MRYLCGRQEQAGEEEVQEKVALLGGQGSQTQQSQHLERGLNGGPIQAMFVNLWQKNKCEPNG